MALRSDVSAEECTGGLLDADTDLRVMWLALRIDGERALAKSMLMRGQQLRIAPLLPPDPSTAASAVREGKANLYVPQVQVIFLNELRRLVLARHGLHLVRATGSRDPLPAHEVLGTLASPCYGSRWNHVVRSFYNPLRFDYARYNRAVLAALPKADLAATANLVRLAYVNRCLASLRRRAAALREERDTVRADSPMLPTPTPSLPLSPSPPLPKTPSPTILQATPPRASPAAGVHQELPSTPRSSSSRILPKYCVVRADPVPKSSRAPRDYIVAGMRVPAHLLNSVEQSLKRDYRLYIQVAQRGHARYAAPNPNLGSLASLSNIGTALMLEQPPVCNVISPLLEPLPPAVAALPLVSSSSTSGGTSTPPYMTYIPPPFLLEETRAARTQIGSPPGNLYSARHLRDHQSLDDYMRNCFGLGWSSVCNAAIRAAQRRAREQKLAAICAELAGVDETRSNALTLRRELVDQAVEHDRHATGLAGCCALQLVRNAGTEELFLFLDGQGDLQSGSPNHSVGQGTTIYPLALSARRHLLKAQRRLALLHSDDATGADSYFTQT